MSRYLKLAALCCAASLAACGGGGGGADEAAPAAESAAPAPAAQAPAPSPTPAPAPAASPAPAPATDKYVGAWSGCFALSTVQSDYETYTFAKQSNTVLTYSVASTRHAGTSCAGAGTAQPGEQGLITFDGSTVLIQGLTGDRVVFDILLPTPLTGKQLLVLDSGKLRLGDYAGLKDAAGYPAQLRPALLQKQ